MYWGTLINFYSVVIESESCENTIDIFLGR